jgi:hypothetical protein
LDGWSRRARATRRHDPQLWKNADMPTRIGYLATVILLAALVAGTSAWAALGDLDPSFGQGGHMWVQTNAGCLTRGCVEFGGSYADAVALQPDGGIVLGGHNDYISGPRRLGRRLRR